MAISKVDVKNNEVVFTFENDFIKDNVVVTLTNRYCIVMRSRWNFEYNAIQDYFTKNGERGCYVGERKHKKDKYVYDVWDLTKVFPEVQFNNNAKELDMLFEF
jgi:hypothetical protein